MVLKRIDVDIRIISKLIGSEIVYTVHRPFSSRYRRESIYKGELSNIEGNNVLLKNEQDLISGKVNKTKIRALIEFEELYKID